MDTVFMDFRMRGKKENEVNKVVSGEMIYSLLVIDLDDVVSQKLFRAVYSKILRIFQGMTL